MQYIQFSFITLLFALDEDEDDEEPRREDEEPPLFEDEEEPPREDEEEPPKFVCDWAPRMLSEIRKSERIFLSEIENLAFWR